MVCTAKKQSGKKSIAMVYLVGRVQKDFMSGETGLKRGERIMVTCIIVILVHQKNRRR